MLLTPDIAWESLPLGEWSLDTARHLLRRTQWTATPREVERVYKDGLSVTLDRLFPATIPHFNETQTLTQMQDAKDKIRSDSSIIESKNDKRKIQKQILKASKEAIVDMSIEWFEYARKPENAAFAKWVLFLSDIYVVGYNKVKNPEHIYQHFEIIAEYGLKDAPSLTKAISRSPAMVNYLDLNKSNKDTPNENFARELMELFVLGEGNYSEKDIKEAARAFTGYRIKRDEDTAVIIPKQHDRGVKTIFGVSGRFDGDGVINIAYALPAAGSFLPHELVKFYLSDTMIDQPYLDSLGQKWRQHKYDLRWLAKTFFSSRLFFESGFRGNFVKSPIQFYLGLLQDLDLHVLPVPRFVVTPFKQMGQVIFDPPNVRGWVGGYHWINSTSLAARRAMVEGLFTPFYEAGLNEDEKRLLAQARASGDVAFKISNSDIEHLSSLSVDELSQKLVDQYLSVKPSPGYIQALQSYLGGSEKNTREYQRKIKRAMITVFSSAEYQLT